MKEVIDINKRRLAQKMEELLPGAYSAHWILVDKKPVQEPDLLKWGMWFENVDGRWVAEAYIRGIHISTVFLCIDYSFGDGPPVLFETMAFGGVLEGTQVRYCTYDEAMKGHMEVCAAAMKTNWFVNYYHNIFVKLRERGLCRWLQKLPSPPTAQCEASENSDSLPRS